MYYYSCTHRIAKALEYRSESTPFSVRRTLRGSSQAWGHLSVSITNHRSTSVQALYLETMPWLVQFHLHTLESRINGVVQGMLSVPCFCWELMSILAGIISNITYIPPIAHSRPTTFQATLSVPPKATVHITMDVTKAFLRYTEHQPDAQRGWDLPPAIFTPMETMGNDFAHLSHGRVYTSNLLVDLATPDFSMPYNVIIFTCSVIAFIFGSIFNVLTRRFVVVDLKPEKT